MGPRLLINALIVLFMASSGSPEEMMENTTASEETHLTSEISDPLSEKSSSAKHLVVPPDVTSATKVKDSELGNVLSSPLQSPELNNTPSTTTDMSMVMSTVAGPETLTAGPHATNPPTNTDGKGDEGHANRTMPPAGHPEATNPSSTPKKTGLRGNEELETQANVTMSPTVDPEATNSSNTPKKTGRRGNEGLGTQTNVTMPPTVQPEATNPSTTRNKTDRRGDDGHRTQANGTMTPEVNHDFTNPSISQTDDRANIGHGDSDGPEPAPTSKDSTTVDPEKLRDQAILIGSFIGILFLLLVIMVIMMLRKKRRSGSFRTQSRKSRQDVWAGQVPELGDGRAQDPSLVENGAAGRGPETAKEQEMTTFVSGEKTLDSVAEMEELGEKAEQNGGEKLGKKDTEEEKTPLLEEASGESPEPDDTTKEFVVPPEEQQLMGNGI